MNNLKEQQIEKYYHERKIAVLISFVTSFFGGIAGAILMALIFKHTPLEIYQKFSADLWIWGLVVVLVFLTFYSIIWFFLVFWQKKRDLKRIGNSRNSMKIKPWIPTWIYIIISIVIVVWQIYVKTYLFAFKTAITLILLGILIKISQSEPRKKDFDVIKRKVELCKITLNEYQTISISLITIGFSIILLGITQPNIDPQMWFGLAILIVGIGINISKVVPRYTLLKKHYLNTEEDNMIIKKEKN